VVAEAILADWPRQAKAFSTIMPRDYRRVLQASRLAELSGRDVDEAIMEAARG
jgi:glutamate synthase (NADPH/NADH) large chain